MSPVWRRVPSWLEIPLSWRGTAAEPVHTKVPSALAEISSRDPTRRTRALPDEKRRTYSRELDDFLRDAKRGPMSQDSVTTILGRLSRLSSPLPDEHLHLAALRAFAKSFSHPQDLRMLPLPALSAVRWWRRLLHRAGTLHMFESHSGVVDLNICVDASAWGVGLVVGSEYAAWRWKPTLGGKYDHNLAALFAVEIAVRFIVARGLRDTRVRIKTDSCVVHHTTKGRDWGPAADACLKRIGVLTVPRQLSLEFENIASKQNLADPVSRGKTPSDMSPLKPVFALPGALQGRLSRV